MVGILAAPLAMVLVLSGCGAETAAGPSNSADSVQLSTGGGPEVGVPKQGLKIGLFMAAKTNAYQAQMISGAEDAAKKYDATVTVYDANYDPKTQMDQLQNAVQQGQINAVVLHPTSGDILCNMASKQLPEKGLPVIVVGTTICGHDIGNGDALAAPGTVAFAGSNAADTFINGVLDNVATLNPGEHTIALVEGPEQLAYTQAFDTIAEQWQTKNPGQDIKYTVYTDYTTPDSQAKTQSLLKAHPDIDLIVSVYSPDITRGVINALTAEGKAGTVPVSDIGGSEYAYEQIRAGNIQSTVPLFPYNLTYNSVEALGKAQTGTVPPRFIDDSQIGSAAKPVALTESTLSQYEPQY